MRKVSREFRSAAFSGNKLNTGRRNTILPSPNWNTHLLLIYFNLSVFTSKYYSVWEMTSVDTPAINVRTCL